MAVLLASQFSDDGKYLAHLCADGKLRIWDTVSNTFEQEITPDFHLTSPCISLHFVDKDSAQSKGGGPKRKKRRESIASAAPNIVLGTTSGSLLLYSITKADVEHTIKSDINHPLNCLSYDNDGHIYSGVENNIVIWDLNKKQVHNKWTSGTEKISAILILLHSSKLLTASKNIKLWDINTKEVIKTFTGHSSEVILLKYINPKNNVDDSYFLSGSKGDRILNCWNLKENSNGKTAIASFLMEDTVTGLSVSIGMEGTTNMAATVRNGSVHVYQHTLNGRCTKPLKPKSTVQVVAEQSKDEKITPIPIMASAYRDSETLCIGYGNEIVQSFENISISSCKKLHCLVRKHPISSSTSTSQDKVNKVKTPIIGNDVHYLTPQSSSGEPVKRKPENDQQIPMETRLENLTLNKSDSAVPKLTNVAHLLVQGLHSKDKNIIRTALRKQDETVIRNTIKRLPMTVIVPFIEELSSLIDSRTEWSHTGVIWLKNLIMIHAGLLLANPDLPELLNKVLGSIELRLSLLTPLNRLRGRLNLVLSQIDTSTSEVEEDKEEALLMFNDREDGSESDVDAMEFENQSDSENDWVEESSDSEENGLQNSDQANSDEDEEMSS